jgi:2-polyprenyl-6-methoxyphenol hydroxylase-like FAD-dependent oxidoreductase
MMAETIDVLIAGAGPTGLMLACELERHGIRARIIDRNAAPATTSRALAVQARTLELFQKLGLSEVMVANGRTARHAVFYVHRKPRVAADFSDIDVHDTPFAMILLTSQVETERALTTRLEERGITIERSVELQRYEERDGGVQVELKHADGTIELVQARYLAGCDGAHSAVRHGSGLAFNGAAYAQEFILGDMLVDWDMPQDQLTLFTGKRGILVCFPLAEKGLLRLIASRADATSDGPEPTVADFEQVFAEMTPYRPNLHDPRWLARFRLHHRVVERYSKGRVFLAGDAAHIHSPAGGQGMNTGIQDAANLAWKLALVLHGNASETLLDSYDAERRPVGERLLRVTDRMFTLATSPKRATRMLRDLMMSYVAPRIVNRRKLRTRAFRFLSQLAIAYRTSPIVSESANLGDAAFAAGPRAGERAPDAPLQLEGRDTTVFAETTAARHHLLMFGAGRVELPRGSESLVDVVHVPPNADVARQRYGVTNVATYLIRPDGYIAYRSPLIDIKGALAQMRYR